jgi:hypothetical protein
MNYSRMALEHSSLSARQRSLLTKWLAGAAIEKEHSWGLVETTVLEVTCAGARFIVKAGGAGDHHIAREIHAHRHLPGPWASKGRAPVLAHADERAKLLVTGYLPGRLVLGSDHADNPDAYRQAGELLAVFHAQETVPDPDYEKRSNDKPLAWLSGPASHRPSGGPNSGRRSRPGRRHQRCWSPPTGTGSPQLADP